MTTTDALKKYKKIAVIGFSNKPYRDSNRIAVYMQNAGYIVYGVNPGLGGKIIDGIKCYTKLSDITDTIEIINVFRNPDALPELINEIMNLPYKPEVIWTQLGVINQDAKKKANENGFEYIENKCIYVEHKLYI
ncbi:CoA-binding protein [soil metagenome]